MFYDDFFKEFYLSYLRQLIFLMILKPLNKNLFHITYNVEYLSLPSQLCFSIGIDSECMSGLNTIP